MSEVLNTFRGQKSEYSDFRFVLPGSGEELFLRPFTTKEQKTILKAMEREDLELLNQCFDQLIDSCVVKPEGFDSNTLLSKDREALLIELRKESVSNTFDFPWKCDDEDCKKQNELNKMNIDDLDFSKLENVIEQEDLPLSDRSNTVLTLGPANRGDEKQILKYAKSNSNGLKKGEISRVELMNATMASCIKKMVIGENVYDSKLKFVDKIGIIEDMSMKDKEKIKDYISNIEKYGYDLEVDAVCSECGKKQEVVIDWTSFFIT